MILGSIPDAFQQILISAFLLYVAYELGKRSKKGEIICLHSDAKVTNIAPCDEFYKYIVKTLLVFTAILYVEAVWQSVMTLDTPEIFEDDAEGAYLKESNVTDTTNTTTTDTDDTTNLGNLTALWLKAHSDFFWFILSCRQVLVVALIVFEISGGKTIKTNLTFKEEKVKRRLFTLAGLAIIFVQWTIGLFSTNPMDGATTGLLFESVVPVLTITYFVRAISPEGRVRSLYALAANVFYIVSSIPVLFIAARMKNPHNVIYMTIIFGCLSFYCWSRAIAKTKQRSKVDLDFHPLEDTQQPQQYRPGPPSSRMRSANAYANKVDSDNKQKETVVEFSASSFTIDDGTEKDQ